MALHAFAMDVSERTGGEVIVDIVTKRTGRPVVEPADYVSSIVSGAIEAASMPTFMWQGIPEMNFSMIPYYFTRPEQIREFPNSQAADFLESKVSAFGVQTLSWIHVTRSSLFTSNDQAFIHPDDLKKHTIVALNDFSDIPFRIIGAKPVHVYSPDIYQAVQSGKANSIMTDVASATGLKFYEIQKFGTVAPFFSAYYHFFVSPEWLETLSEHNRQAILEAAKQLNRNAFLITEARAAASPDVLREGGMTIHIQTPEEQQEWQERLSGPSMDAFLQLTPDAPQLISLLDKL